jgi:Glycosyl hydrolases family 32 N-terminal domain
MSELVRAGVLATLLLLATCATAAAQVRQERVTEVTREVAAGEFERIYDPGVGEAEPWYINDHTFVRAPGRGWHLFGITHAEPANPLDEDEFAHATADRLTQSPWDKQPPAFGVDESQGEIHLWAPHVVRHRGLYYMFYAGGDADHARYRMQLATSRDLEHWTRHPGNPLFQDGFDARDPYVMRHRGRWVMYYTANSEPTGGRHIVAYRTSSDLIHWSGRRVAYTDPRSGTFGGPTESPFVQRRGRDWYLFICCTNGYRDTKVLRSRDPLHFEPDALAGRIDSHAAEVVRDERGRWYVSSAGWGQGGVHLAPLDFDARRVTERVEVTAPGYSATVTTRPEAALTSLRVNGREVLSTDGRGTVPYAGVGAFGATDRPGAAASVESSADGRELVLRGIPMGDEQITVDWRLNFGDDTLDQSFTWHVEGASAPVWEAGWSLNTTLPTFGDEGGLDRRGDVAGFPPWAIAYDDEVTLAAAYRDGSAWGTDNRWYDPPSSGMSWQPHWQPGGRALATGTLAGGTWRLGVSPRTADTAFAERLHEELNGP